MKLSHCCFEMLIKMKEKNVHALNDWDVGRYMYLVWQDITKVVGITHGNIVIALYIL